jgi:hypothetical protein
MKIEKVEPWLAVVSLQGVCNPRLAGLEREAQRAEPVGDEVVAAVYNSGVLMEDHY